MGCQVHQGLTHATIYTVGDLYDTLTSQMWYMYIMMTSSHGIAFRIADTCKGSSFNYIFILDLTLDFKGLDKVKDNCKTRRETYKLWDLVQLILDFLWYITFDKSSPWNVLRRFIILSFSKLTGVDPIVFDMIQSHVRHDVRCTCLFIMNLLRIAYYVWLLQLL